MLPALLTWLLRPLAAIYGAVMRLRNHLYAIGQRRSVGFQVFTISVGNLAVGGTGKTPHVEYLLRHLLPQHPAATLSRGYGRRTRGVRLAQPTDTAATLGDEPMQFWRKFGPAVTVAVAEERILAVPEIMSQAPATQVLVLDDAYQHQKIQRHLNLLLTDWARPFYHDWVLPAGRLREPRQGANRADAVLVTKCPPSLDTPTQARMAAQVRAYAPGVPVFFTGLRYHPPQPAWPGVAPWSAASGPVVLVSGLANAQPLEDYVRQTFGLVRHLALADHFAYTPARLQPWVAEWQQLPGPPPVLTTEKDWIKWQTPEIQAVLQGMVVYYLPVEVSFLDQEAEFLALLAQKMAAWQANQAT
ncbi:MAG: tetraacyldisaccharide 4'-kinase [Bernardetiaceae bacterium]|jgi:tetraacyldisaccharide 4'-kinase|nr:tetraacyldisaccharide 4'-kinase [Bernardetiaceae bacterium]